MSYLRGVGFILIVSLGWSFAPGCGSCKKKPAPTISDASYIPEPQASEESAEPEPSVLTFPEGARLPARLLRLPPSYLGLDRRTYVRIRVESGRMGQTERDVPNPTEMAGFDLAALDVGDREVESNRWNKELVELYTALLENKVFSAAKPMVVFWNADAGHGKMSWSIGVPVAKEIEVPAPLLRKHVPPMKVHVERGLAREILARFGGRLEDKPTYWTFVHNVRRAASSTITRPAIMIVRFPDWDEKDLNEESEMEVILGEPAPVHEQAAGPDTTVE